MNIWIKSVIAGAIIAAPIYILYLKANPSAAKTRNEVHYVVKIIADSRLNENLQAETIGETPVIIMKRIKSLGYDPKIKISGDILDISIEHVDDTAKLSEAIKRNNKIEFRELYTLDELPTFFQQADKVTTKLLSKENDQEKSIYTFLSPTIPDERAGITRFPPAVGAVNKNDTTILNRILQQQTLKQTLPVDLQFCYGILTDDTKILNTPDDVLLYAGRLNDDRSIIQNNDIETAIVEYNKYNDRSAIYIRFNNTGTRKWKTLTSRNIGRYIAVVIDSLVIVAPLVGSAIDNGEMSLMSRLSEKQAIKLANQLKMGLVPADLVITRTEIIPEKSNADQVRMILTLVGFVVTGGITFAVFKALKNS